MRRELYVLIGVVLVPTVGLVGDIVTDGRLISTTEGGPPLEVASAIMVAALNADRVDGFDADAFALATDTYTKAEVDALIAAAAGADSRSWYYLSATDHSGADTDSACDSGFHMASLYEVVDVSNLRYDTGRGTSKDDSGSGPPSYPTSGWVRTGSYASNVGGAGFANCSAWTSSSFADYGSIAALDPDWDSPATAISPWVAFESPCGVLFPVWCIQD